MVINAFGRIPDMPARGTAMTPVLIAALTLELTTTGAME